jgi:hypothetical protein
MKNENVPSKSNEQNNLFFVGIKKATDKKSRPESVSQWYGSGDPDPYQNVSGPQH